MDQDPTAVMGGCIRELAKPERLFRYVYQWAMIFVGGCIRPMDDGVFLLPTGVKQSILGTGLTLQKIMNVSAV